MPGSCGYPDSTWSRSSSSTFNSHAGSAGFDMDDWAFRTNDRNDSFGFAFQLSSLEADVAIQSPRQCLGGSQHPCTPNKNGWTEEWESPGATPPPASSSPDLDFSQAPAHAMVLATPHRMDMTSDRPLSVHQHGSGQSRAKAVLNNQVDSSASIFSTTTSMHPHPPTHNLQVQEASPSQTTVFPSLHLQSNPFRSGSSMPTCRITQGLPDERLSTTSEQTVTHRHGICAPRTQTPIEATSNPTKTNETNNVSAWGGPGRLSRKRALVSGPTMLGLSLFNALEPGSSRGTDKNQPCDATTGRETQANSDVSSKLPYRRVPIVPISRPAQTKPDSRLKRQCSSVDCPPESKRLKLERTLSYISSVAESDVGPKYQATEPASLRRAASLRSEVSECSNKSTVRPCTQDTHQRAYTLLQDSLFYPSPLSSPGSRSRADKDDPPTVPSTPLPDSVDYDRSKANPMVRTIRYYRRRSLEVPPIPPVPIIAPPEGLPPTTVRCSEDYAIDRIKALLQRERGERERDGLDSCDDKRAARLKDTFGLAFSRRDSGNTSDSSINQGQWEDVDTLSPTESQESKDSVLGADVVYEQHRLATRDIWSDAFGITNDFRKEVTRWMVNVRKMSERIAVLMTNFIRNAPKIQFRARIQKNARTNVPSVPIFMTS